MTAAHPWAVVMTPRENALLLRLCAAELTREPQSVIVLRRILRDLGWTDTAMDTGMARIRAALVGMMLTQEAMFDSEANRG